MTPKSIFRDAELCVNCKACVVACKVKHMFPPYPSRPDVSEPVGINLIHVHPYGPSIDGDRVNQSFVTIACMHCEDPPCLKVCPTAAIFKDGATHITLVKRERCIGCRACLWVCPYGVPSFDEEGKLVLCDLCIDRLKEGKQTACEATCPARAIFVGTPEEIAERQARKAVERIGRSLME
jgi:Fe-S-cluster-containing dehydrogenase component